MEKNKMFNDKEIFEEDYDSDISDSKKRTQYSRNQFDKNCQMP